MDLVYFFELVFISLFTLFFFVKGLKNNTYRMLALFFLVLSLNSLSTVATVTGFYNDNPGFLFFDMGIPIALGPLFYFYVDTLVHSRKSFYNDYWFHLLPLLFYYVLFLDLLLMPGEEKLVLAASTVNDMPVRWKVVTVFQLVPVPVYLIASSVAIGRYQQRIRAVFSDIHRIDLKWLRLFSRSFAILWLIVSVSILLVNYRAELVDTGIVIFNTSFFIFGLLTGLMALMRERAVGNIDINDKYKPGDKSEKDESARQLLSLIRDYMNESKIYQEPEINLHVLASEIGIAPHRISRVINEGIGKNFFDFINTYRVEEFKERVRQGDHLNFTILSIAYECGFNSKSAFYRAFKQNTGLTPNSYISGVGKT